MKLLEEIQKQLESRQEGDPPCDAGLKITINDATFVNQQITWSYKVEVTDETCKLFAVGKGIYIMKDGKSFPVMEEEGFFDLSQRNASFNGFATLFNVTQKNFRCRFGVGAAIVRPGADNYPTCSAFQDGVYNGEAEQTG
jgi:hypothetical protein